MQHRQKRQHVGKHNAINSPGAFRTIAAEAELRQRHDEVDIEPLAAQECAAGAFFSRLPEGFKFFT